MNIRHGGITASVAVLAAMIWIGTDHVRAADTARTAEPVASGTPVMSPATATTDDESSEELIEASADPTLDTMVELAAVGPDKGSVTNLPVPRYVSLKASEANVRRGPSLSHRIDWVFRHRDMPLRVTAEYGHWRRVEDRDGVGGWLHYSLISGVRTVVFTGDKTEVHGSPSDSSGVTALAEQGAIARLDKCDADWCEVKAEGTEGWVRKAALWGVDPRERVN